MSFRFASSFPLVSLAPLALAFASLGMTGCSKDAKTDVDAAADAAPEASVADAAVVVDAAVDATTAPLTTAAPVKPKTAAPDPPMCQRAREAKARNSPAFPALEKQCKALGGSI